MSKDRPSGMLERRELSRRQLMQVLTAAGGGLSIVGLLAACAQTPAAPTATVAPTQPAPAATAVLTQPAPAATAVPTQPAPAATAVPTQPAPTAAPKPTTAAMAKDQVLRKGFAVKLTHFDPVQEGGYGRWMTSNVFVPPFFLDEKRNLLPGTCRRYDVSADGLTYTLYVDPAAQWSDGSKFTAKDLKGWMEYAASPRNPGPYKNHLRGVTGFAAVNKGDAKEMEGLVAVDDLTMKIVLTKADPLFPIAVLATYHMGGPKPEVASAAPKEWWLKDPAVTGPFKIEKLDFEAGDYTFVPNPRWWRESKPLLTRVQGLAVADPQTLMIMWDNNQVDTMFLFGEEAITTEEKYPESVVRMPEYGGPFFWLFNTALEPTNDIMVRKALRHAIDVPSMVTPLYRGKRKPTKGPLPPGLLGSRYDTIDKEHESFKYDPELARKELAQSKYGSADKLPTIVVTPSATAGDKVRGTEMVVEMWRRNLGITKIESRPRASDFGTDWNKKVNLIRTSGGGLPDAGQYFQGSFGRSGGWFQDYTGYKNAEFDALADKAYYMDRKDPEYVKAIHKLEDTFLSEYLMVPLYLDEYSYYVKPWVKNFRTNWNNLFLELEKVYLAPR